MKRFRVLLRGIQFAFMRALVDFRNLVKKPSPWIQGKTDRRGLYLYEKGRAGETKSVTVVPGMAFRGDQLIATDTSEEPGRRTKIMNCFIGNRLQMSANGPGVLTEVFCADAVGNVWVLDTCRQGLSITFQIRFLVDCAWKAELWGIVLFEDLND